MNFTLLLRKFPVSHVHKSTSLVLNYINIYTKNNFKMKSKSHLLLYSTTSINTSNLDLDINKISIKQKQKNEELEEKARFLVIRNILNYIRTSGNFSSSIANPTVLLNNTSTASIPSGQDILEFKLSELLLADNDPDHNGYNISTYLFKILSSTASDSNASDNKSLLTSAMIDCDNELVTRALVLDFHTCLRLLDIWMLYLGDSEFHRVSYLKCFVPLLKSSFDQIHKQVQNNEQDQENYVKIKYPLIHLAYIGSLGKKDPGTARLLNEVLKLCSRYPQQTFKTWSGFETAIMCNSFYRCGIQVLDHGILDRCAKILVEMCRNLHIFDVSVLITVLKVFRQANYYNESLPSVLKELVLASSNTSASSSDSIDLSIDLKNLSVISHLSATFLRWRKSTEKPSEFYKEPFEQLEKYMCEILTSPNLVRRRIKDVSRWLWAGANLGLEIDPNVTLPLILKAFKPDDIYFDPVSAIEMFLALTMMGHSIEPYLNLIVPQDRFAVALRYDTQSRQKERFGLLLYSLKVEHGDVLGHFPARNIARFEKIVGPPNIGGINWLETAYPIRHHNQNTSGNDQSSHSELINKTMRFLRSRFKGFQVLRGFAVPYLHIPGLKLESERCTIFIEVIDDSFSYGLFQFKLRILNKMGCNTCLITQDEINKADFKELFKNITTIVT